MLLMNILMKKKTKEKNNSKIIPSKNVSGIFKRGDLLFEQKDLLITKSKMYIKVDRKDKNRDFKIFGEPLDESSKYF